MRNAYTCGVKSKTDGRFFLVGDMASIGSEKGEKNRSYWSAEQFRAWQDAIGMSGQKASKALGVSDNSITNYRQRGCPRTVALACIALYGRQDGLKPWERSV